MDNESRNISLEKIVSDLDISPTDFERARSRYRAVADWLTGGEYASGNQLDIYIQGSFRLGTVIRPYRNSSDADYDIDQVCEINGRATGAGILKNDVGDRLKENGDYDRMLDEEGRRCWTLIYASQEGRPGFHLDVLPSRLGSGSASTKIDITHKNAQVYSWKSSNPKGYYEWFKGRNFVSESTITAQQARIFEKNGALYRSASEVPKQLIRTNLQRSIQLMKRHRDVFFDGKEFSPISIIITTICAHRYAGTGIYETIVGFCDYVIGRFATAIIGEQPDYDGILDYVNGSWIILNPADSKENFADRWREEREREKAFFSWTLALRRSLYAFDRSENYRDLCLASFGGSSPDGQYSQRILNSFSEGFVSSSEDFLNLIHLGIEGKLDWSSVNKVAVRNVDEDEDGTESKDIAWVNYYQVRRHAGYGLTSDHLAHIRRIRENHNTDSSFIFCCSLLLGEATIQMLRNCLRSRGKDALGWPIVRLAPKQNTDLAMLPIT